MRLFAGYSLTALILIILSMPLQAGTYYVSPTGTAAWADCEHNAVPAGPKSGTSACNLAIANANVAPGDTVYLREGVYYPTDRTNCIHSGQSGTAGNRIVYQNYNGENVTLDGDSSNAPEAMLFCAGWDTGDPNEGRSYITVKGINFTSWNELGDLRYASYNEITECYFFGHRNLNCDYNGFFLYLGSKHNWIHQNTWHSFGHFIDRDASCIINIGHDNAGTAENSGNDYNTVENNHFYSSGHHVIGVNNAKYNIIRNNYFHNEGWSTEGDCSKWPTGVCGYRVMSMTDASGLNVAGSNLLEDNNIAYGAQYGGPHLITGASGSGLTVHTDSNIVRYCNFFGNVLYGLRIGSSIAKGSGRSNHIYNNTFYYNGYNMDSWGIINEDDSNLYDNQRCAFSFYSTGCDDPRQVIGNVIKNNLAHETWSETNNLGTSSYYPAFITGNLDSCNTVIHNWGHTGPSQHTPFIPYPDPMFIDPDIADPMALYFIDGKWTGKPDLSLKVTSPAIDSATYLTQAKGNGLNEKILYVNDARYFQDGTWGSDLARANLHADWIAIGKVSNTVQIKTIDYGKNCITLISPMTWSNNDPVWLFKKSNGDIVLYGKGPDYGAHEYVKPAVIKTNNSVPSGFSLDQNYPNPFNPITNIEYRISNAEFVTLKIFDVLGREVITLVNKQMPAGIHTAQWDGKNTAGQRVGSGIYYYKIQTSDRQMSAKKMLMLK
ncbi:MAG: T9SS type A sorting domain-containing protein [Calditrichaceae bacterium]|nr:T9SS type A sorting domain-containing protein [Calditrichaceae bacterium]RQV92956.1 MAG: T9SS C-terminal target domain-containing protein [Calditrichota bacterium]